MTLQATIEQTVQGLGLDLVEVERLAGGLLRVTIDVPWPPAQAGQQSVTIDDCERVTRQLQYALEVAGVDYARLEVSSPGLDRLLRHEQDLQRFVGEEVNLTLKEALGANDAGIAASRKKFSGTLERTDSGWQIVWSDAPPPRPGQRISRKKAPAPMRALGFTLDEVREVRLAAVVDFKGRSGRKSQSAPDAGENSLASQEQQQD